MKVADHREQKKEPVLCSPCISGGELMPSRNSFCNPMGERIGLPIFLLMPFKATTEIQQRRVTI